MDSGKSLYFIAVVPPLPEREKLWSLKREFSEKYATKAALRSPPHITLHMPFQFRNDREQILINTLGKVYQDFPEFDVCLNGYGAFPPRVIYADVGANELLHQLQKDTMALMKKAFHIFNANYRERPFRPHLTLAFRDLKKGMFHQAWEEYQEKELTICWRTKSVALLRHNGRQWEILQELDLKFT